MVSHVKPSKWGSCTLAPAVALFDQQPHRCPVSGNVLFEDQMYADVEICKIVMLSVMLGLPNPSNAWVLRVISVVSCTAEKAENEPRYLKD